MTVGNLLLPGFESFISTVIVEQPKPKKPVKPKKPKKEKKAKKEKKPKNFTNKRCIGTFLLLGGGVQSGTLAEMIVEGVIEKPTLAIFADTGNEPYWVINHIGYLRKRLASVGVPLITTARATDSERTYDRWAYANMWDDLRLGYYSGSIPVFVKNPDGSRGRLKRHCTTDYKIGPTNQVIREWMLTKGYAKIQKGQTWREAYSPSMKQALNLTMWQRPIIGSGFYGEDYNGEHLYVLPGLYANCIFGISTDEDFRADPERGISWQKPLYPLLDMGMSRDDCVAWLKAHGLPVPQKSACFFCPYKSNEAWLWLKTNAPDVFEIACQIDDWLRSLEAKRKPSSFHAVRGEMYLHESCIPLREVDFEALIALGKVKSSLKAHMFEQRCSNDGAFTCHG